MYIINIIINIKTDLISPLNIAVDNKHQQQLKCLIVRSSLKL